MATSASIQFIRNATLILHYNGRKILVDPMFSPKGTFDPIAGKERNPMVELPISVEEIIRDIDSVLVTHTHPDHFDPVAMEALDKSIRLFNQPADKDYFSNANFTNAETITDNIVWDGITIYRTGGEHGSGKVLQLMGTVSGFVLNAKDQPTIYIVGDSVWINEVEESIQHFKPDYIVTNSGGAEMPGFVGTLIILNEEQTVTLV
ncbi:MBL fold metallo-hydrolase [Segetibacter sp. 3557_3]|uniref:MBL fold metallo-hydrolase n=1 Tax=Segetibacter sp. 3557_3 TaxID=2547429 RepID=UPI0010588520|nr:MBL fold metallo-hydrolase [Segetibacter sp. 3557_3]TDH26921.1 MBL fold metallo-hydrolase [Segetibacter sp. 3557_3]